MKNKKIQDFIQNSSNESFLFKVKDINTGSTFDIRDNF